MDTETIRLLFAILRSAISGEPMEEAERALYRSEAEALSQLVTLAKQHDVAHLVAFGLKNNGLWGQSEWESVLEKELFKAVYRCETQEEARKQLCECLEEAEIPFLPLKGSVIRTLYPEPWMRTSCDIDVLVPQEWLERAVACLTAVGFRSEGKDTHDVSLFAPNGTHVELHYSLMEDHFAQCSAKVLDGVWRTAVLHDGGEMRYDMPEDMFYFYHIAHMAKHFENGGCGIRPFVDLWILRGRCRDAEARQKLLREGGLLTFAEQVERLSEVWLGQAEHTELTRRMEAYLLQGGVHGTLENHVAVQQVKRGGKVRYMMSRIWLPYESLCVQAPILKKHRWLMPIMEVRRWGHLLLRGRAKRSWRELRYSGQISSDEADRMKDFLAQLGL